MVNTEIKYIYSECVLNSVEEFFRELSVSFKNSDLEIQNIFNYNIFCKDEVYAFYDGWDRMPNDILKPIQLIDLEESSKSKLEYVRKIKYSILKGEISKPSWFLYIEMDENVKMNFNNHEYTFPPSTFLHLSLKNEKYEKLGLALLKLIYSVNENIIYIPNNLINKF